MRRAWLWTLRDADATRVAGTILVVDGNIASRVLTCTVLAYNGYAPVAARSTAEAIEIAASGEAVLDVAVVDMETCRYEPEDVVQRLRRHQPTLRPIYMARRRDRDIVVEQWLGPVVSKPIDIRALLSTVRKTLGSSLA